MLLGGKKGDVSIGLPVVSPEGARCGGEHESNKHGRHSHLHRLFTSIVITVYANHRSPQSLRSFPLSKASFMMSNEISSSSFVSELMAFWYSALNMSYMSVAFESKGFNLLHGLSWFGLVSLDSFFCFFFFDLVSGITRSWVIAAPCRKSPM